jgi:hypothetical protein
MRLSRLVCALLLSTSAPAFAQDRSGDPRPLTSTEQTWLAEHNFERDAVGLPPLRWNPSLASDARGWAEDLAARRAFHHSPDLLRIRQGENLWRGSARRYEAWQMIDGFLAERRHFRPGTFPDVSATGRWSDVGHYTQIIWPETREVGCALAANTRDEVLVCRYWPAGNVLGYRLEPVQRLTRR